MDGNEKKRKNFKNVFNIIVCVAIFIIAFVLLLNYYGLFQLTGNKNIENTTEAISETEKISTSSLNNDNKDKSSLDHEKKLEIYDYIETEEEKYGDNITDEQTEKIWKKAEKIYKITESDIYEIMSDADLIKEYYSSLESEETDDYVGQYDAVLSNSGYGVVVAVTKEAMDEYISALSKNNKDTIQSLYSLGYIAKIPEGTKVDVIEAGISVSEVRILEGIYKGYNFYSINECIELK
ncbi:MAG: hypothetical protein V8R56_06365 [Eubacterium sp.]